MKLVIKIIALFISISTVTSCVNNNYYYIVAMDAITPKVKNNVTYEKSRCVDSTFYYNLDTYINRAAKRADVCVKWRLDNNTEWVCACSLL